MAQANEQKEDPWASECYEQLGRETGLRSQSRDYHDATKMTLTRQGGRQRDTKIDPHTGCPMGGKPRRGCIIGCRLIRGSRGTNARGTPVENVTGLSPQTTPKIKRQARQPDNQNRDNDTTGNESTDKKYESKYI